MGIIKTIATGVILKGVGELLGGHKSDKAGASQAPPPGGAFGGMPISPFASNGFNNQAMPRSMNAAPRQMGTLPPMMSGMGNPMMGGASAMQGMGMPRPMQMPMQMPMMQGMGMPQPMTQQMPTQSMFAPQGMPAPMGQMGASQFGGMQGQPMSVMGAIKQKIGHEIWEHKMEKKIDDMGPAGEGMKKNFESLSDKIDTLDNRAIAGAVMNKLTNPFAD